MSSITHGPVLGALTDTEVKVWAVFSSPDTLTFEYVPYGDAFPGTEVSGASSTDNLVQFKISSLTANTRYSYRVKSSTGDIKGPYDFVTLPGDTGGVINIFQTSDTHLGPSVTFDEMENRFNNYKAVLNLRNEEPEIPAILVMCGDHIPTSSELGLSNFRTERLSRMTDTFDGSRNNGYMELVKYVPVYAVYDDHDGLINNWYKDTISSDKAVSRIEAKQAWVDYWPHPDLDPDNGDGINFAFSAGKITFIALDGRYNKGNTPGVWPVTGITYPDWVGADYLGFKQLEWFKRFLVANQNDFIFIMCNTTMTDNNRDATLPAVVGRRDSYGIYHKTERNNFLKFLDESTQYNDVFFNTGDDHDPKVRRINSIQDEEYDVRDSSVDYSTIKRHYFKKLVVWDIKGSCGEIDPFLGTAFGTDDAIYDGSVKAPNKHHFFKVQVDTSKTVSTAALDIFHRTTNWNDDAAGAASTEVIRNDRFVIYERPDEANIATQAADVYRPDFGNRLLNPSFEEGERYWDITGTGQVSIDKGAAHKDDAFNCLVNDPIAGGLTGSFEQYFIAKKQEPGPGFPLAVPGPFFSWYWKWGVEPNDLATIDTNPEVNIWAYNTIYSTANTWVRLGVFALGVNYGLAREVWQPYDWTANIPTIPIYFRSDQGGIRFECDCSDGETSTKYVAIDRVYLSYDEADS